MVAPRRRRRHCCAPRAGTLTMRTSWISCAGCAARSEGSQVRRSARAAAHHLLCVLCAAALHPKLKLPCSLHLTARSQEGAG
jgi:hypothetical protein